MTKECNCGIHPKAVCLLEKYNEMTGFLGSLTLGCHLYSINTHHGVELRIVAAIRNKLLLITRKHPRLDCLSCVSTAMGATDSPVEEFQYIRVGEDENVYE